MCKAKTARTYEDFKPLFDWKREDGSDIVVINLPGFKKEQLKLQLDAFGKMRISAERPLDDKKWIRSCKDFHVPEYCIENDIRARFDNGILYVTMPKKATQTSTQPPVPLSAGCVLV
ncbi:inactive protein RESTRICTED TEV MOVEMENT 2-like [Magnolia sinica]|uniref:inactive protein RESTRICTED TEV MOVEMENT 2-like n=1 Tax=Magnolia sinica TaxID=86752 RepID=UPI002659407B|nr:inactive protein RESTRICTED TEV MOVEMENT 2-like [Magnolia sinica]